MADHSPEGVHQSSHEIRRSETYRGLDRRVGVLVGIKKGLDTISADEPPENVRGKLQDMFSQFTGSLPPEIAERASQYKRLEIEKNRLEESLRQNDDDQTFEALEEVKEEHRQLAKDPDVVFTVQVEKFVNSLIKKNEQVATFRQDPSLLREEVQKCFRGTPDWSDWADTVYSPFSISLIWGKEESADDASALLAGVNGVHIPGTPFNFIRNRLSRSDMDNTILHEDIHNMLEETDEIGHTMKPRENIARIIGSFERTLSIGMPLVGSFSPKTRLIEASSPEVVINGQHEEILTHLQVLEKLGFDLPQELSFYFKRFEGRERGQLTESDALGIYSTAGNQINRVIELLKSTAQKHKDDQLGEICDRSSRITSKTWHTIVTDLRETLGIARRLGPQAHQEIHSVYYLLKPTQFHHARGYLEEKYGKDQVEQAETTMKFVQSFRLDAESVDEQLTSFNTIKDSITTIDRDELKRKLDLAIQDLDDVADIGIYSLTEGRAFLEKLDVLKTVINDAFIDELKRDLFKEIMYCEIRNSFIEDIESVPTMYDTLTPDEQAVFRRQIEVYVDSTVVEDLYKKYGNTITYSSMQDKPEWQIFEQFGVQQNLEKAFREEEEYKNRLAK